MAELDASRTASPMPLDLAPVTHDAAYPEDLIWPTEAVTVAFAATSELIEDAHWLSPWFNAWMEYEALPPRPLTLLELVTGWRHFTSSNGTAIALRVGWRNWIHELRRPRDVDDEAYD